MSRHHAAHAGDVTHIINDIRSMSKEEAETVYGIELREGGIVYDVMYRREFSSLGEWADFNVREDEFEYEEDINHFKEDRSHI